jgi:hypothetical protein
VRLIAKQREEHVWEMFISYFKNWFNLFYKITKNAYKANTLSMILYGCQHMDSLREECNLKVSDNKMQRTIR